MIDISAINKTQLLASNGGEEKLFHLLKQLINSRSLGADLSLRPGSWERTVICRNSVFHVVVYLDRWPGEYTWGALAWVILLLLVFLFT